LYTTPVVYLYFDSLQQWLSKRPLLRHEHPHRQMTSSTQA
jgi:hypothetical protein